MYSITHSIRSTPSRQLCLQFSSSYHHLGMIKGQSLETYKPPRWIEDAVQQKPSNILKLAHTPTPIHEWHISGLPCGTSLFIKRDDMTGSELGGNKIRKLEFLFADAIASGYKQVATMGGLQSNHCRITALVAAKLGLKCHLFLRASSKDPTKEKLTLDGNLLLSKLSGAKLHLVPEGTRQEIIMPLAHNLAEKILKETGEKLYIIPLGGSNALGAFGYMEAFQELIEQGAAERFTDIVVCTGSGGTLDGLAIANELTGSKLKIHAINVCDSSDYFYGHLQTTLDELELDRDARRLVRIIDGYKGLGYGRSTDEELDFIEQVAHSTGILLDPTYTGKAVKALVNELNKHPEHFNGRQILYVHTGGQYGALDGKLKTRLESRGLSDVEHHCL